MLDRAVLEVVCHAAVESQNSGKRKGSFSCIIHWSWKHTTASRAVVLTLKIKKKKKNKEEGREGGRKEERKKGEKEREISSIGEKEK